MKNLYTLASLILSITIPLVGFSPPVIAEETDNWNMSLSTAYMNRFVGTVGAPFAEDSVFQTNFNATSTISTPCGNLYFNFWWSVTPKGGISSDFGDEMDYKVGCAREYEKLGGVVIDFSVSIFDLYELGGSNPVGDVLMLQSHISKQFDLGDGHSISPYFLGEYAFVDEDYQASGWTTHLGVKHYLKIGKAAISGNYEVFYDSGVFIFEPGWIFFSDTGLEWKLGKEKNWTLTIPKIRFSTPINTPDRETELAWGVSLGTSFN